MVLDHPNKPTLKAMGARKSFMLWMRSIVLAAAVAVAVTLLVVLVT